ncbi:hypothetical protein LCGC14_2674500 [marine sediment metagenome]|uniref:Uncharacterized protein n=1 Tax=marine sediment metagenome TaxID=412755 RepID=A0A0F9AAM5_9ZZZZ
MKLKSGKTVSLTPLTTTQKVECFDILGDMERIYKWAMYGLGLVRLSDFDKPENNYTTVDIGEIAVAVVEATEKGTDPTTKG